MNAPLSLGAEALPSELHELLNSPDGPAFEQALDVLVREREQKLFRALGLLARDLHDAVRRLGGELVQEGYPDSVDDARKHLRGRAGDERAGSPSHARFRRAHAPGGRVAGAQRRRSAGTSTRRPVRSGRRAGAPGQRLRRQLHRRPGRHGDGAVLAGPVRPARSRKWSASSARSNRRCWNWCA